MLDRLKMIRNASNLTLQPQPAGDRSAVATAVLVQTETSGLSC